MKRIIAALIAAALFCIFAVSASALKDNYSIDTKTLNGILDAYRSAVKNGETYVSLSKYGIYDSRGGDTYNDLIRLFSYVNGDVGCISFGKYSETYVTVKLDQDSSGAIKGATITYSERYRNEDGTCNRDLVKKEEKLIQERFNKAKAVVDRKMTDVEKALVLYDYLITSADYPESLGVGSDGLDIYKDDAYKATGFFIDREAVCAAYAKLYAILLNESGIPAVTVENDDLFHEWVMLKVDGEWYHADITWDDPYYEDGYTYLYDSNDDHWDLGCVTHEFFLKSDEEMTELGHPDWSLSYNVNPDYLTEVPKSGPSGKFDNMFFSDKNEEFSSGSKMNYINGNWYFIDLKSFSVIRANIDGTSEKLPLPDSVFPKYSFGYGNDLYVLSNKRLYRYDVVSDKYAKILEVPEDKPNSVYSEMRILDDEMTIIGLDYEYEDGSDDPVGFESTETVYDMSELESMDALPDDEQEETAERSDDLPAVINEQKTRDDKPKDKSIDPDIDPELIELAESAGKRITAFIYLAGAAIFVVFAAIAIILAIKYSKKK